MDRQLDTMGSYLLTEGLKKRGIEIYFNDEVREFIGDGKIEGIELKSGRKLKCDALVYGVGTVPNIDLIKKTGLECKRGVLVNDVMQTSDPSIFAIGEIIEWNSQMYGIVAAAEQQANVAASYLNGDTTQIYKGTLSANILKIPGINVCSIGVAEIPIDNAEEYEEVSIIDKSLHYYKKCIIHKDKLFGAILIGDRAEMNEFKEWMSDDIFLEKKRDTILRGNAETAEPVIGALVCSCNGVGVGNITNKIKSGCQEFSELCKITKAGTGCGSCRPQVKSILEKTLG
jgi:ferredoxin-nitrate reductase